MPVLDPQTRSQILSLYATGLRQADIAERLRLPEALIADVLDCKL